MGALETLYALVYGKTPDSGGGADLLGAPDRLKMYAIQKLLQGNQAIGDYHDWMNDLDIEARGREGRSFDEDYLDEDTRKRIAYARQKMAERRASSVAGAEKSGEVAQERGGSSYRAAEYVPDSIAQPSFDQIPVGGRKPLEAKPTFNYDQFKSSLDSYVSDSLQSEAEDEAERRANSVNIDIPGGYESLQRIRQQAGGKPGGGTLSVMGGSLTGGDTTEDLRRYVEEAKRNQLDIKIATIEASAPAKYRSPATNQYLDMLYKQKAEEEASSVAAMNAAANMRQAQTEAEITGPAQAKYYNEYGPSQIRVAELGVEEAGVRSKVQEREMSLKYFDDVLTSVRQGVKDQQVPRQVLVNITGIIYDPNLSFEKKVELVNLELGQPAKGSQANLSESDALLFQTP